MKYITKFILMGIVAVAGLLSACTSDDFEPGPLNSGAQVYFPNTVASEYSVADTESSVIIPVRRIVTDEAMTISILSNDDSGLFNIPSSVVFNAGEAASELVITFDRSKLEDGSEYPISLLINDDKNITDYGNYMIEITIVPWPWEVLGTGKFRDDWFAPMWQNGGNPEIDVTIHRHKSKEGVYMVEEMFGWPYLTEFFEEEQSVIESNYVTYQPTNITIDCSDPTKVVIPRQFTGIVDIDPSYGNYEIAQYVDMYGTLENGIITYPKEAIALVYADGQKNMPANKSGLFRIMLPGAEDTDYSLGVSYEGMKVNADNTSMSALIDFTYGADVTGISYVIADGDVTDSTAEIAASIIDGTAFNIYEIEDFVIGAGTVSIEAEIANTGIYTVVAVPKDKANKPLEKNASSTMFYFPGMSGSEIPECDIHALMGLVSEYSPEDLDECPDTSSLYFEISGSELKSLNILLANTSDIEALVDEGATYELLVDTYGDDYSKYVSTINQTGVLSNIWINLKEKTSYTMLVKASNIYGKSDIVITECATAAPDYSGYTGDLVIGNYLMSYEAATSDGGSVLLENNLSMIPQGEATSKVFIRDFALEIGVDWYAEYNEATNELTLSGIWKNNESNNYLGGWVGFGGTEAYLFRSMTDPNDTTSEGKDPIVLNVDPTTKQLTSLKTYIEVYVGTVEGGYVTDNYLAAIYAPGSTIELLTSAMPASVMMPSAMIDRMLCSPVHGSTPYAAKGLTIAKKAEVAVVNASRPYNKSINTIKVKTSKYESQGMQPKVKAKINQQANKRPLM